MVVLNTASEQQGEEDFPEAPAKKEQDEPGTYFYAIK